MASVLGPSLAASVLLVAAACSAREATPPVTRLTLTAHGLGPVRLCISLDSVGPALGALAAGRIRDSVFTGEDGSHWPGRVASLARGGTVTFESSWVETTHVWRISTNAPSVRTVHGASVGTAAERLPPASGPVALEEPEGEVVLTLGGDSVGALLDNDAARGVIDASEHGEPAPAVPRGARIRKLVAAGDCRVPAPAS